MSGLKLYLSGLLLALGLSVFTGFSTVNGANINDFVYSTFNYSVVSQYSDAQGVFVVPAQSKAYACGASAGNFSRYDLSDDTDISTSVYQGYFDFSAQASDCRDIEWSADGSSAYVLSNAAKTIYQYDCSTSYLPSSCSYSSNSLNVNSQTNDPLEFSWQYNGDYLLVQKYTEIYQYNCSISWDISSCSYASLSLSTASQDTLMTSVTWSADGSKVFAGGLNTNTVYQYNCSDSTDVSSCSYSSFSLSVASQSTSQYSTYIEPNGNYFYLVDNGTDTIYQYDYDAPIPPYTGLLLNFLSGSDIWFSGTILNIADGISYDPDTNFLFPTSTTGYTPLITTLTPIQYSGYFSSDSRLFDTFEQFGLNFTLFGLNTFNSWMLVLFGVVIMMWMVRAFIFSPKR